MLAIQSVMVWVSLDCKAAYRGFVFVVTTLNKRCLNSRVFIESSFTNKI